MNQNPILYYAILHEVDILYVLLGDLGGIICQCLFRLDKFVAMFFRNALISSSELYKLKADTR